MTLIIVSSIRDPASINIKERLLEQSTWEETGSFNEQTVFRHSRMQDVMVVTINDSKINHENLDREVEDELGVKPLQVIFISRHKSKTGEPSLTVHPVGNYGEARFGGRPRTLVKSSPFLMTCLLRLIREKIQTMGLGYKVCYEVTHHGPYLDVPTFFVEIGSTEKEWKEKEPAEVIARSMIEMLNSYKKGHFGENIVLLGIGGGHYAPRFTDIVFEKKAAFGHMIPLYQIEEGNIDPEMLRKAVEATPELKAVYIHKKTLKKSQVTLYRQWFLDNGIPVVSSKELPSLD
jgi:D-aminoacyl-tRNA deacylase